MNQPTPNIEITYNFQSWNISDLEGKMLTLIDASIGDIEQRKALKDIARQTIWNWAISSHNESKGKQGALIAS